MTQEQAVNEAAEIFYLISIGEVHPYAVAVDWLNKYAPELIEVDKLSGCATNCIEGEGSFEGLAGSFRTVEEGKDNEVVALDELIEKAQDRLDYLVDKRKELVGYV